MLTELVPQITDADVFICGPAEWNNAVRDTLRQAGVTKTDIHIEDFSW